MKNAIREYLKKKNNKSNFKDKLDSLYFPAYGLASIHNQGLIHRDLHSGNILNSGIWSRITDLGLSQPINNQKEKGKIFGVLPYVAPEVLRDHPYTQEADVYSFGMVAYELFANAYPYPGADDLHLAIKICQGLRPNIDEVPIPKLLKDLIKKCWDADPTKRLSAWELKVTVNNWRNEIKYKNNTQFYQQYKEIEEEYNHWSQSFPYQIHLTATVISKPIKTKEIAKLFQNSKKQALGREIKKIEKEINQSLTDELKELVSDFIQARKQMVKNENYEEAKGKALELEDQLLDEKGLEEENIEKIISYCKRLIAKQQELQAKIEINTDK